MNVTVSTPSRLHFGLLRFEQADGPSFGGMGMMIDGPREIVELTAADAWSGVGPNAERAIDFARRALASVPHQNKPHAVSVQVLEAIPEHRGLGGGTQLALAVAAGVRRLGDLPAGSAAELAATAGRGLRSAIGCHGFVEGGLLFETGRESGETLGRLAGRVDVPSAWRIVLVAANRQAGLSGESELSAFKQLPPVPCATSERLARLAQKQIMPAAQASSFDQFSASLYEYGRLAGECFAAVQGGPYASTEIAACVAAIRRLGVRGVGQSSWGPTVFAFAEDASQAEWLAVTLRGAGAWKDHEIRVTAADNTGAHLAPGQ